MPYHVDRTMLSTVAKHQWPRMVLAWETVWELQALLSWVKILLLLRRKRYIRVTQSLVTIVKETGVKLG